MINGKQNNQCVATYEANHRFLRKLLSVVGARIALELCGIKCVSLEKVNTKKHSTACTRSFGQTIKEYSVIKEAVLAAEN